MICAIDCDVQSRANNSSWPPNFAIDSGCWNEARRDDHPTEVHVTARVPLDLSLLPDGGVRWLDASGAHADIVISTRMRLARNVSGYSFSTRAREGERLRMLAQVRDAVGAVPSLARSVLVRLDDLALTDRQLLHERHLVSKELAGLEQGAAPRSGAAVFLGDSVGLLVNEEDHLRLQALRSGFEVAEAFAAVRALDSELGAAVPYAWHREFGFLTACPTNVGTGLRASVLIHLPGLVLTKEIGKVLAGLQQMGLTYRGLYGEGSEVVGNFFQLSNQTTLGRSADELQDLLVRVVRHVIEREEEARRVLVRDAGYIIEDKLWRAYGTLRYARSLTFDEAMNYLSGVRLAVGLKLITGLSVYTLNKMLIFAQSAHLAKSEGRVLSESDANLVRARFVRQALVHEGGAAD
jgi:protein arginine kinase